MESNANPYRDRFLSIDQVQRGFEAAGYVCGRAIATTLYVGCHLNKPILVEGPAGVGKTELANVMAAYLGVPLIRLQCYEGLDESKALYEWKYGKQLLYTQILRDRMNDLVKGVDGLEAAMDRLHQYDDVFFSINFLEPRPLLKALQEKGGAVLLIDEVDKSDPEFEAFLLEILSDFQVSIPEIGTLKAASTPFVFLTSNNTREMSEALKRRCLHLYIPFPDPKIERAIVRMKVPAVPELLRSQLVSFIHQVRNLDLKKAPSVSETIDWARVLLLLHAEVLTPDLVQETLNVFLKFEQDVEVVTARIPELTLKSTREFPV
ncbi:MAG: MoxR family ATPase [Deltaproteobacteria bacterium]|nr:MoxR family ATPase [Deltaproteobacteria bacterium]